MSNPLLIPNSPERLAAAHDRGRADAYYSKPTRPRIWLDPLGLKVCESLTREEVAAWREGLRTEPDRKEWE